MGVVHADRTTKDELGLMMTGSLDMTKNKNYGIAKDSNIVESSTSESDAEVTDNDR